MWLIGDLDIFRLHVNCLLNIDRDNNHIVRVRIWHSLVVVRQVFPRVYKHVSVIVREQLFVSFVII